MNQTRQTICLNLGYARAANKLKQGLKMDKISWRNVYLLKILWCSDGEEIKQKFSIK